MLDEVLGILHTNVCFAFCMQEILRWDLFYNALASYKHTNITLNLYKYYILNVKRSSNLLKVYFHFIKA